MKSAINTLPKAFTWPKGEKWKNYALNTASLAHPCWLKSLVSDLTAEPQIELDSTLAPSFVLIPVTFPIQEDPFKTFMLCDTHQSSCTSLIYLRSSGTPDDCKFPNKGQVVQDPSNTHIPLASGFYYHLHLHNLTSRTLNNFHSKSCNSRSRLNRAKLKRNV